MNTESVSKPKRNAMQLRTTEEFDRQIAELMPALGLRTKSAVVYFSVKETYDRRFPAEPSSGTNRP